MQDEEGVDDEEDENTMDDKVCMNGIKYKSVAAHYSLRDKLMEYIANVFTW